MEASRQMAEHSAHDSERHEPTADVDWDAYYWAPVPSKHIPCPLPHSLSRRIAFDILYCVFDNLDCEADRSSITLVCKEWYRCFGGIRYPDLCIRDREGLHSLLAQYARCERVRRRFRSTMTLRIQQRDGSSEVFCDTVPLVLGTRMPAVRTLVFHGCIRPSMHPTFAKGLRLFRTIRCLELSTFVCNFGELYRMLVACPLLEALILRDGRYVTARPPRATTPLRTSSRYVRVPKLRRLELRRLDTSLFISLVDWLARATCCENIAHLTISESEFTGVGAQLSTRLLQVIGPSLKQLSLVGVPVRMYEYADDLAPSLAWSPSIMQVDVEVEALSSESFRRLTSGNGFVRTWWPILKTVPEHVRQRICLNVIRMGWDILARDYSKPIGRALYEGDLLRLRLWEGEPICGFATGAAGSDQCRYIIEDVANCQWHLKSRHPAIPPIPHMSYVTAYAVPPIPQVHVDLIRKQGIVMCCSTPGFGRAPCREIMVADPAIVAAHFESQHTLSFRCSWVEPGSWRTKSCDTLLVEHSLEALLRHIVTQHIQNLPYEDLAVPQPNVPLVERACEMLAGLPRYDYT